MPECEITFGLAFRQCHHRYKVGIPSFGKVPSSWNCLRRPTLSLSFLPPLSHFRLALFCTQKWKGKQDIGGEIRLNANSFIVFDYKMQTSLFLMASFCNFRVAFSCPKSFLPLLDPFCVRVGDWVSELEQSERGHNPLVHCLAVNHWDTLEWGKIALLFLFLSFSLSIEPFPSCSPQKWGLGFGQILLSQLPWFDKLRQIPDVRLFSR